MYHPWPPTKLPRHLRMLLALLVLATLYGLGFALYITSLPTPFTTIPPSIQGLAVFTGGAGRVDAALTEIHRGFSGKILISGKHQNTTFAAILARAPAPLSLQQQAQITLDEAPTTHQNIKSLGQWAQAENLTHIGIITSTYHAARVRLLSWIETPHLTLTILAVQPENTGLRVLWHEYNKLLAAPFLL